MRGWLLLSIILVANADAADWHEQLAKPDPAFSQMPFWFWNDELDDDEIKRQMAEFREHGVYGFVIHPRMGLSKDIPYMGERYLGHVRVAVEEAARTGMQVCLYDEWMYPSGSAHGEVVRSNAALAAQGLMKIELNVTGPKEVELIEPKEGVLIATVLAQRVDSTTLDESSFQLVSRSIEVPAGSWCIMTFVQVPSDGRIRGVYPGEEDTEPGAPRAADLLNPEAVKAFIRFGYEPYAAPLSEHFGKTVIGMFTDEPNMLGRLPREGLVPWTTGLAEYFRKQRGYDLLPHLPALFEKKDRPGEQVRSDFELSLTQRLDEVYYTPLSVWCAAHNIVFTGHPSASDDILVLHRFQLPGQDMVWRWILPNNESGLEGVNSTVGKCASSVARHDDRRFSSIEIYGAYGWQLTLDEMKWLADWMLVRGINRFVTHAFYYSVREDRGQERPPDLGMHNTWWPHYRLFADYTSRLCGLLTDSEQVCEVAILSVNNHLPWRAAKGLFQHQIDFNYLEDRRLCEQAKIEDGKITAGKMAYKTLIVDQDKPLSKEVAAKVSEFEKSGGKVLHWTDDFSLESFDLVAKPQAADLRSLHLRKYGVDFFLLTNEGESKIDTTIHCGSVGRAEWFDAWTGRFTPAAVTVAADNRMTLPLQLNRRETRVLCVDGAEKPTIASVVAPATERHIGLAGPWAVLNEKGEKVGDALGDWRKVSSTGEFVGTLRYETSFTSDGKQFRLNLGEVGDWAVVRLNGEDLGPRFWAPFEWDISDAVREGKNELMVEVTNSLANRFDPKNARPSGLFGPVVLK